MGAGRRLDLACRDSPPELAKPRGKLVYAMIDGTGTESSRPYLSAQPADGFVISCLHMYKS